MQPHPIRWVHNQLLADGPWTTVVDPVYADASGEGL